MNVILKLFSLKFVTALLGVAYTILQVRLFGATREIEIFFAAQSLVYLVTSLTQSGQLAEVFLPIYHQLNKKRKGLGYIGLNIVINRMLLYGGLLIVIVFLFAPFFIQLLVPGFSASDQQLSTLIFRVLLPYLILQLVNSFFITVLNAEKRYGRAELLGLTNTSVSLTVLFLFYSSLGIWALAISLLVGKLIEFLFYTSQLYKSGFRFQSTLSNKEFDHQSFFNTMTSTLLYVSATQIYNIVLTASISFLPEGVFAIFKYVQNLANKIQGLFIQPFIIVFYTTYSNLIQNIKSVSNEFKRTLTNIIYINTIIMIGIIMLGDSILDLIWGGDKFTSSNIRLAYFFLLFNSVGMLIGSIGIVYRKMSVAHGRANKLYLYWAVSQLLTAFMTYFFIRFFFVNGLFLLIPINVFLLGVVSYIVYKKTPHSLGFNLFRKNIIISIFLVVLIAAIRYLVYPYITVFSLDFHLLTMMLFFIAAITYPLYLIYSNMKSIKYSFDEEC